MDYRKEKRILMDAYLRGEISEDYLAEMLRIYRLLEQS